MPDVAALHGQESAGEDPAHVVHKAEATPRVHRVRADHQAGRRVPGRAMPGGRAAGALGHEAAEVLALGDLDDEVRLLRKVVQLAEQHLHLARGHPLELGAPAGRHQEEDLPEHNAQALHQLGNGIEIVYVPRAQHGVHLQRQTQLAGPAGAFHGLLEGALHAPELVVLGRGGPVNADGHLVEPGIPERLHTLAGEPGRGGGNGARAQPYGFGVPDKVFQVGALQRIAPREDNQGSAHGLHVIDQALALFQGELAGVAHILGGGPAVAAGQGAGPGDFPDQQQGGAVEIDIKLHTAATSNWMRTRRNRQAGDGTLATGRVRMWAMVHLASTVRQDSLSSCMA